ncbi:hypothetical protein B0H14DRAFT_3147067 [Mycena olivaceomarginata]|nr:hypothetical protein B0H14DRAFT_3147067 [Mycena olivaceomarginata]
MESPLLHRPYNSLLHEEDQGYPGQSVSPSANSDWLSSPRRGGPPSIAYPRCFTASAGSENSKMNAIDISAIPRIPTMLNTRLSCEWKWNPDTFDAGSTPWAENTASPMEIITPHGEYVSEPLASSTTATAQSLYPPARISSAIPASLLIATFNMRKPGAAVSSLSPARTLSPYTALQAPPPIGLQYLEGDVDAASARYVSLADLTGAPPFPNTSHDATEVEDAKSDGSGTRSESESEFDADDSGEFVPLGDSNSS